MQWLKADQYKIMPWKNGGGTTREILLTRDEQGEMQWRLSIATIGQSGPFSSFPDIDRTIALLDGDEVTLNIAEETSIVLNGSSQPFAFAGEAAVDAVLKGGETTDLNIMTRRSSWKHQMVRMDITQTEEFLKDCEHMFIVCNDDFRIECNHQTETVSRFDTILIEEGDVLKLQPSKEVGTLFVIAVYSQKH